ncbi:MAG: hypothetical protein KC731_35710, partial [Myxococcales bacterium]|nr:hypothetical protein [Myxococcales bacterium]
AGLPVGEGTVGLDRRGHVVRTRGQRFGDEVEGALFIGVHVLSARLRERLPREGCLVGDVYLPALAAGEVIRAAPVVTAFSDVGTLDDYAAANFAWLERRGAGHHLAAGASVGPRVRLERAVVGEGARITGVGLVRDTILWPGAEAVAPLDGVVVTTRGQIVPWRPSRTVSAGGAAPR